MKDSDFPLFFYLTPDGMKNIIRTCPETRQLFEGFQAGLMSWESTLTCIIEIVMQRLKQSQPQEPNMN